MAILSKIQGSSLAAAGGGASVTANTVLIGPITVESGKCDVVLMDKTASGTITTPTNPKLQISVDPALSIWTDVSSGSVATSSSSSTAIATTALNVVCRAIRVVSAGAFAAGNADVYLFGAETASG